MPEARLLFLFIVFAFVFIWSLVMNWSLGLIYHYLPCLCCLLQCDEALSNGCNATVLRCIQYHDKVGEKLSLCGWSWSFPRLFMSLLFFRTRGPLCCGTLQLEQRGSMLPHRLQIPGKKGTLSLSQSCFAISLSSFSPLCNFLLFILFTCVLLVDMSRQGKIKNRTSFFRLVHEKVAHP